MTRTAEMLNTYPADLGAADRKKLTECIEACFECAQVCTACAEPASAREESPSW